MSEEHLLKLMLGVVWPLVLIWNGYLHNCINASREDMQDIRLDVAKNYISADEMDKFIDRMEKRFDRLDEKFNQK